MYGQRFTGQDTASASTSARIGGTLASRQLGGFVESPQSFPASAPPNPASGEESQRARSCRNDDRLVENESVK